MKKEQTLEWTKFRADGTGQEVLWEQSQLNWGTGVGTGRGAWLRCERSPRPLPCRSPCVSFLSLSLTHLCCY